MNYVEKECKIMLGTASVQEADLTIQQRNSVNDFVVVTMECDKEMLNGIDHQIPMTFDLYRRTIDKLEALEATRTLQEFRNDFAEQFAI